MLQAIAGLFFCSIVVGWLVVLFRSQAGGSLAPASYVEDDQANLNATTSAAIYPVGGGGYYGGTGSDYYGSGGSDSGASGGDSGGSGGGDGGGGGGSW